MIDSFAFPCGRADEGAEYSNHMEVVCPILGFNYGEEQAVN